MLVLAAHGGELSFETILVHPKWSEIYKKFKAILRLTAMLSPLITTAFEIILD